MAGAVDDSTIHIVVVIIFIIIIINFRVEIYQKPSGYLNS